MSNSPQAQNTKRGRSVDRRAQASPSLGAGYRELVEDLKVRVVNAQLSAARRINHELVGLSWDIGRAIVEKQKKLGWGESVVGSIAEELQRAFPKMRGFSPRNVWDMKRLYEVYSAPGILTDFVKEIERHRDYSILRQSVAELPTESLADSQKIDRQRSLRQLVAEVPWGQNLLLLNKLAVPTARLWYLRATARFGWSRNVLLNQIKAGSYERAVTDQKTHNFEAALPQHFAEQAGELAAFDLKVGPFEPESAGKMDFHLNLLNDQERGSDDQPSIGIILCAEKDDVEVEYALRSKANPIGVAAYTLQSKLPGELKGKLPTARQLAEIVRAEYAK